MRRTFRSTEAALHFDRSEHVAARCQPTVTHAAVFGHRAVGVFTVARLDKITWGGGSPHESWISRDVGNAIAKEQGREFSKVMRWKSTAPFCDDANVTQAQRGPRRFSPGSKSERILGWPTSAG